MTRLGERLKIRREMMPEETDEQIQNIQSVQPIRPIQDEEEEDRVDRSPLSIVKEIKENPSQKGTFKTIIGGIPVDLHVLEGYLVSTSPFALKTVMRYHNARNMEEIKNYSRGINVKMNSKTIILIIICILMVLLGVFFIFFMPKIMATFQGGI